MNVDMNMSITIESEVVLAAITALALFIQREQLTMLISLLILG